MKKTLLIILTVLGLLSPAVSQKKIEEKDLGLKYRDWLKLTAYVILPQEKDVFLRLDNDRDRDIFIESFWKQRDPTPDTPQNEFKDEHYRRFRYANEYYRRGTPREGWMTDMGRMYIILGAPRSIERFEGMAGIHPCQVWYYYGESGKKLPTYFGLVFFQRGGSGEFKLYNPNSDGPYSLLVDTQGLDVTDYEKVYLYPNSHAGYYPGAQYLAMKILFRKSDGRLLGAQAVGLDGVDKRIDVLFIPPRTRDMYSLVAKTWCPDRLMLSTRMLSIA
jgi:GWxTD domain-containing protein